MRKIITTKIFFIVIILTFYLFFPHQSAWGEDTTSNCPNVKIWIETKDNRGVVNPQPFVKGDFDKINYEIQLNPNDKDTAKLFLVTVDNLNLDTQKNYVEPIQPEKNSSGLAVLKGSIKPEDPSSIYGFTPFDIGQHAILVVRGEGVPTDPNNQYCTENHRYNPELKYNIINTSLPTPAFTCNFTKITSTNSDNNKITESDEVDVEGEIIPPDNNNPTVIKKISITTNNKNIQVSKIGKTANSFTAHIGRSVSNYEITTILYNSSDYAINSCKQTIIVCDTCKIPTKIPTQPPSTPTPTDNPNKCGGCKITDCDKDPCKSCTSICKPVAKPGQPTDIPKLSYICDQLNNVNGLDPGAPSPAPEIAIMISKCKDCMGDTNTGKPTKGVWTAIGCIPTDITTIIRDYVFKFGMGISGGIAFLYFLYGSFLVLTSAGNPERVEEAKQIIISSLSGMMLIIFSVLFLSIIGVDILGIPGLGR
jgi:hypothetical protein